MWPQIKKTIADFILEDQGSISKSALIKMGLISSFIVLSSNSVVALNEDNTGWVNLDVNPVCKPPSNWLATPEMLERPFRARLACDEPGQTDKCYVEVDTGVYSGSPTYHSSDTYCSDSAWDDVGKPWVDVDSCDFNHDEDYTEKFKAFIRFNDIMAHENSINIDSSVEGELLAEHTHSITPSVTEGQIHTDCDYSVYIKANDGGDDCEVSLEYSVKYVNSGEVIVEHEKECFDM